ncbi:MAG: stage V sporulation protein AD [Ruminococcaceae bacterium]|nr:stage V sporulation protein AD [Oscillospiraceae bacterium]
MRKEVIKFKNPPSIISSASVVGRREHEGPFGNKFDIYDEKDSFGMPTWEQSEGEMQRQALNLALSKASLKPCDIDAIFAGDLINQCTSSSYGLLDFDIPYFGLYGACSTCAESLLLSAMAVSSGSFEHCAAVTSSHNCSAERQFRFPLEYGSQRTPTSQWTATASGAFIVSSEGKGPHIVEAMGGISTDMGIKDANNMGAAMAPAAISTLSRYFTATDTKPTDYDKIITGDLGFEGYGIVIDIMGKQGYDMRPVYTDCGLVIYDRQAQDMHAGGSGCGCSAALMASHFLDEIRKGIINDVLFIGTGALLSQMSVQQGLSIPGVAHLVRIKGEL